MTAPIRIAAVCGSVRPGNFTGKVLGVVVSELQKHEHVQVDVIDPAGLGLAPPGQAADAAAIEKMQELVEAATGVVLSTPEYHGSYSSVIKLVIENLKFPSALAGKPVALVGCAAGQIGAIKALEHLRSICSHVGALVLPGPVSVASVNQVFDEQGRITDAPTEKRIRGAATGLLDYTERHLCPRAALESFVRSKE